jgi:Putative prokaryotic signal transducing protein
VELDEGVLLTIVSGPPEADIVCGLLRANGIDCGYRDTEAIDSTIEDFIEAGPVEVLVPAEELEAAREVLAASQE